VNEDAQIFIVGSAASICSLDGVVRVFPSLQLAMDASDALDIAGTV